MEAVDLARDQVIEGGWGKGASQSLLWYQYDIVFCMNEWGPAFTLYCVTFYLEWRVHKVEGEQRCIFFCSRTPLRIKLRYTYVHVAAFQFKFDALCPQ